MKSIHLIQSAKFLKHVSDDGIAILHVGLPFLDKISKKIKIESMDKVDQVVEEIGKLFLKEIGIKLSKNELEDLQRKITALHLVKNVTGGGDLKAIISRIVYSGYPEVEQICFSIKESQSAIEKVLEDDEQIEIIHYWSVGDDEEIELYTKYIPYEELHVLSRNVPINQTISQEARERSIQIEIHMPSYTIISSPLADFNPIVRKLLVKKRRRKLVTLRISPGDFSVDLITKIQNSLKTEDYSAIVTKVLIQLCVPQTTDLDEVKQIRGVNIEKEQNDLYESIIVGDSIPLTKYLLKQNTVVSFDIKENILRVVTKEELSIDRQNAEDILSSVEEVIENEPIGLLVTSGAEGMRSFPTPFVYHRGAIHILPSIIRARSWGGIKQNSKVMFTIGKSCIIAGTGEMRIEDLGGEEEDYLALHNMKGTPLITSESTPFLTKRVHIKIIPENITLNGRILHRREKN